MAVLLNTVFNSFYYHIRRTHALYFTTGQPPTGWMTSATSDISRVGSEHFDIPVFSDCATETRGMQRTNSEVNTPVISNEMLNPEPTCHQIPHPKIQEGAGASSANIRHAAAFAINVRERCHLSQRSVNSIVSEVQQYQTVLLNTLRDTMKRIFERHSDSVEQLQEEVLATLDNFHDPFSLMATTYMQDSTIQKLFNPVKPEEDIMHIILEGVAPMEIKCVLKYLVLSGQMELDVFNSAMQSFPLSLVDVRDKPCPISVSTLASNDNKLKQSSGQMLILLKIMPFLLNTIEKNEYVQFVLDLIEIIQILFAPVLSVQTVLRLRCLIEQHLKVFKQLFPENNIIPKQHYLLHLPAQILSLGPMVRHMCMRFESKHCFFKQWSSKLNFKNVCKSLMKHNQLFECCQNEIGMEHPMFLHEKEVGPVSEVANMEYVNTKMRDFLGINGIQHTVKVKWLILNGNKYICDRSLIITNTNETVPVFGFIKNIYVVDSLLYCFEYQLYDIVGWNRDLLAYEVAVSNLAQATEFIDAEKLVDHTSYYPVNFKNTTYVLTKYYLGDVVALKH
ncbi:hypothetical protein PAMP_014697 [Pampus punctatissimus]